METTVEYTGDRMYVTSDYQNVIRKIRKLKEQHPDEVKIDYEPEKNDGCICAWLPTKWLRIAPPPKRELTDEQKQELNRRLSLAREKQKALKECAGNTEIL